MKQGTLVQAFEDVTQDRTVQVLAHRIAVHVGIIRQEQDLQAVVAYDPTAFAGLIALADEYATIVRATDDHNEAVDAGCECSAGCLICHAPAERGKSALV